MKKNVFKTCAVVFLSLAFLAAGIGLVISGSTGNRSKVTVHAVGDGSAGDPFIIADFNDFVGFIPEMATPGTVTSVKYFKITADFNVNGALFPIGVERNLANNIVIYGEHNVGGGSVTLGTLNASLFNKVFGPNTVIKNINFSGVGNIASEFSGVMDNVHHTAGNMQDLNASEAGAIGGLVDISRDATFRHCSNSSRVLLSTSSSGVGTVTGGIIGEARGNLSMSNTSNSGTIETFNLAGIDAAGGLVGRIINDSNETAIIELSNNGAILLNSTPDTTKGIVVGRRTGGLVGKKEGAGKLEVSECFNAGRVSNRGTSPAESAGILAWVLGGTVDIRNCYNRGDIVTGTAEAATTTKTTASAGIFSTKVSASTVTISRTYNTGTVQHAIAYTGTNAITTAPNYTLSGSYTTLGINVTSVNATTLNGQPTVDALNLGQSSPVFMQGSGGSNPPPVLVGLTVYTYSFEVNAPDATITSGQIRFTNWTIPPVVTVSLRPHYTFEGWSEDAQAQTTAITNSTLIPVANPITQTKIFYAVWSATKYTIDFVDSRDENPIFTDQQDYEVCDFDGVIAKPSGSFFVVGQSISLRTQIKASTTISQLDRVRFVEWQVIPNGASAFETFPITTGVTNKLYNLNTHPAHFNIYESNENLIDDTFISEYVDPITKTMTVRGLYEFVDGVDPMFDVNIEAVTWDTQNGTYIHRSEYQSWGTTMIDSDTAFPSVQAWKTVVSGENAVIKVKPNTHYSFVRFDVVLTAGGTLINTAAPSTPDGNGFYFFTLESIAANYTVYAVLKRTEYKITVTAQTVDGEPIIGSNLDELLGTNRTYYMTIGSAFNEITFAQENGMYKLFHEWQNNYKIKLPGTASYELRSTNTSGQIIIKQTEAESFLSKFWGTGWDPAVNEIIIIAIYVRQVEFSLSIPTESFEDMGTVSVRISHPDPSDTYSYTKNNGVGARGFRYGSIVDIYIELKNNARIQDIKVNSTGKIQDLALAGAIFQDQYTMSFSFELLAMTNIEIAFETNDYIFNLEVVDASDSVSDNPLPAVEKIEILDLLHTEGREWKGEKLAANDKIQLTLEKEMAWSNDWRLEGLWIIYNDGSGETEMRLDTQEHSYFYLPMLTLIDENMIITLELDDIFIEDFQLHDYPEFTIQIRFTRIFNISIELSLAGSGDAIIAATGQSFFLPGKESTRRPFAVSENLKIYLAPGTHYQIAIAGVVDLDNASENIEIQEDVNGFFISLTVTEERRLRINYVPRQYEVDTSGNNGKGTIFNNNLGTIGVGTEVVIEFKPSTGLQRSTWAINGVDVKDLASKYGMTVRVSGNSVRFTVNDAWLNDTNNGLGKLNSVIGTELNTFLIVGIIALAIIIPGLAIGIILMMRANKKRQAEYALAMQKMKQAKARLGAADMIKNLREE